MAKLSANMITALCGQYQIETMNAFRYTEMASWARYRGLEGIAGFLAGQAEGERGHAAKVLTYLESRNEKLEIFPFQYQVGSEWLDIDQLMLGAYYIEIETTASLYRLHFAADAEGDLMSGQWLMDPAGLIKEQVEEENLAQTILDRFAQYPACPGRTHDLDLWVGSLK